MYRCRHPRQVQRVFIRGEARRAGCVVLRVQGFLPWRASSTGFRGIGCWSLGPEMDGTAVTTAR
jgi:hypothetical protein